jgi:quercetin dioxygenase-like cupin family protein
MGRRDLVTALALVLVIASVVWAQGTPGPAGLGPVGLRSTTILQTTTTAQGQLLLFPLFRNQFIGVLLEIAPGGRVGRHMHPVPNVVYVLEGELTVEADGHAARVYRAGQAFSEGSHWHDGINNGSVPLKVWVVFAGEEGVPVTVRP